MIKSLPRKLTSLLKENPEQYNAYYYVRIISKARRVPLPIRLYKLLCFSLYKSNTVKKKNKTKKEVSYIGTRAAVRMEKNMSGFFMLVFKPV